MALATPVMLLTLFGYALTLGRGQRADGRMGPERDGAEPGVYQPFRRLAAISRSARRVDNYDDLERAIDRGQVMMGLVVPRDFAQQIDAGRDAAAQLIVDGSDSNTATIAIGYADVSPQIYAHGPDCRTRTTRGGPPLQIPLDVRPRVWFNEDLESRNYIIPGLIAVIMMVIAAMLTSLTVAREWERGTMEQLISTPVKPGELILGKWLPYFAIGMCDLVVAVLMAEYVFHVPCAAMWRCCSACRRSF